MVESLEKGEGLYVFFGPRFFGLCNPASKDDGGPSTPREERGRRKRRVPPRGARDAATDERQKPQRPLSLSLLIPNRSTTHSRTNTPIPRARRTADRFETPRFAFRKKQEAGPSLLSLTPSHPPDPSRQCSGRLPHPPKRGECARSRSTSRCTTRARARSFGCARTTWPRRNHRPPPRHRHRAAAPLPLQPSPRPMTTCLVYRPGALVA